MTFHAKWHSALHFEKSSNTAKILDKVKKFFPIITIIMPLKWPLLEPKVFIVLCRLLKSFVFKVIRFFQNYTLSSTSLRRVKRNCF